MGSIQMRDRQTDKPPLLLEHDSHHQQAGCITKCGVIPETQNTQYIHNTTAILHREGERTGGMETGKTSQAFSMITGNYR